jgi:hypothetical protein
MTRKHFFLPILSMALLSIAVIGCSSTPTEPTSTQAEPTPTPDQSIVWADDFEDGDTAGWRQDSGKVFFVTDEVLTTGPTGGDIYHESIVSNGTWSFDVYFPEEHENYEPSYQFCVTCDKDWKFGFGIGCRIEGSKNTSVFIITLDNRTKYTKPSVSLGRKLVGWNHFDITRDELGNANVYLNGELILQHKDELNISPHKFYFNTGVIGPVFDNLLVRNQVIDIRAVE